MSILKPKTTWHQAELLDICDQASRLGLLGPLTAGNCSARNGYSNVYMSRAGADLHSLRLKDLLKVKYYRTRGDGSLTVEPRENITSEWRIHAAILETRTDTDFVLHAHPPFTTAAGIMAREHLPFMHYYQAILGPDPTPVVDFKTPGSSDLAEGVMEVLETYRTNAILLANHGCVVFGHTGHKTLRALVVLEEICKLFCRTQQPNTMRRAIWDEYHESVHEMMGLPINSWPY